MKFLKTKYDLENTIDECLGPSEYKSLKVHDLVIDADAKKIGVVLELGENKSKVWWAWTEDWAFSMEDTAALKPF